MSDKDLLQSQPMRCHSMYPINVKNYEIDIFDFIIQLWKRKGLISGCIMIVILLAGAYSYIAKEQWTATVVVDKPNFDTMDNYYRGIRLLEGSIDKVSSTEDIADKLFKQFINQAGSYNELTKFINESSYFKQLSEGKSEREKAIILNEIIGDTKITKDKDSFVFTIYFSADTAESSKKLLENYMQIVNINVSKMQYNQLSSLIENKKTTIKNQMAALRKIAEEKRLEEIENIKLAQGVAEKASIDRPELNGLTKLEGNNLFLLGKNALNAMSEGIKKQPLVLGDSYYDLQRQYINLDGFKVDDSSAKAFSYLKSPMVPTNKDRPKRLLILIAGFGVGLFIGIGYVFIEMMLASYLKTKNVIK